MSPSIRSEALKEYYDRTKAVTQHFLKKSFKKLYIKNKIKN